jgi:hypothetical protein
LEKVPVHVATGLTPAQVKAYRLADNKTGQIATWDEEQLVRELLDLQRLDVDLDVTGFSAQELAGLLNSGLPEGQTDPDEIPAPPDKAQTQPGDLWLLGDHRLLCGESSKAEDVDRLLGGAPVHLVHTDPPYNVKVEPRSNNAIAAGLSSFAGRQNHQGFDSARKGAKGKTTKKLRAKDRPLANDFVTEQEFDRLLHVWFGNIARVLQPGRAFYLWGGYANCANYPPVLKACRLYFSQALIWHKQHPVLTRKDFMGDHEWCFYAGAKALPTSSLVPTTCPTSGPSKRSIPKAWSISPKSRWSSPCGQSSIPRAPANTCSTSLAAAVRRLSPPSKPAAERC